MEFVADAAKLANLLEWELVFEFLVGLNSKSDWVRSHVLGKDIFPSLHQVFSLVCLEESRLGVMMKRPIAPSTEISALNITDEKGTMGGEKDPR